MGSVDSRAISFLETEASQQVSQIGRMGQVCAALFLYHHGHSPTRERRVLLGKSRSIRSRIAAIFCCTAAVTAVGAGLPWLGAVLGVWGWPVPSSWYGVFLGLLGGAIVLFEMALLPRKWFRWLRLVPTKIWMRFHVWLGLICLPVILVHAGFGLGGPLAAVTLVLFLLVTASGIWGLVMQQWLPEKMLAEVPSETVASQIDFVGEVHTAEAIQLIAMLTTAPPEFDEFDVRPAGRSALSLLVMSQGEPAVTGIPAEELLAFGDSILLPFLRGHYRQKSPLVSRTEAGRRFNQLRDRLPEPATPVIERLEELADLRRQWDFQARLNWWLHGWLVIHLPLSIAMTGLMLIHAVRALKYW